MQAKIERRSCREIARDASGAAFLPLFDLAWIDHRDGSQAHGIEARRKLRNAHLPTVVKSHSMPFSPLDQRAQRQPDVTLPNGEDPPLERIFLPDVHYELATLRLDLKQQLGLFCNVELIGFQCACRGT